MEKKKFDKYNINDYEFYAGRNKYDMFYNKNDPKLENTTDDKLVWNVFLSRQDSLGSVSEHIKVVNVFELNWVLNGHLYSLHKFTNREKFDYELRSWLMNQVWSRVQYEIIIGDLWDKDQVKVDVYKQIMINWFHFEKYCWEHKHLFKNFKEEYKMNQDNIKYWRRLNNGTHKKR